MAAYLGELLPGYDPGGENPAIRLCPHALMDRVWEARRSGGVLAVGDVLSDGSLVARAYRDDVAGIPVLGDLEGFQDFARQLEPEYKDILTSHGICGLPWDTLCAAGYLYPRGQCADYMYWALTLLRHQAREVAV